MNRKTKKQRDRMKYYNEGKRVAISMVIEWVIFNLPFLERDFELQKELRIQTDLKELKKPNNLESIKVRRDEIRFITKKCWELLDSNEFRKKIAKDICEYKMGEEPLE
jgi:hypothetical protein